MISRLSAHGKAPLCSPQGDFACLVRRGACADFGNSGWLLHWFELPVLPLRGLAAQLGFVAIIRFLGLCHARVRPRWACGLQGWAGAAGVCEGSGNDLSQVLWSYRLMASYSFPLLRQKRKRIVLVVPCSSNAT
jgi:hypothetical protein